MNKLSDEDIKSAYLTGAFASADDWTVVGKYVTEFAHAIIAAHEAQRQAALAAWQDAPTIAHADAIRAQRHAEPDWGMLCGDKSIEELTSMALHMGDEQELYDAQQHQAVQEPDQCSTCGGCGCIMIDYETGEGCPDCTGNPDTPKALEQHQAVQDKPAAYVDHDQPNNIAWCPSAASLRDITPLYTAPQPAPVPEGYKLVPLEPTEEMHKTGAEMFGATLHSAAGFDHHARCVYRAMLAAAPDCPR